MASADKQELRPHLIEAGDVVFTNDIHEALADRYVHTCLHVVVILGEVSFRLGSKEMTAREGDSIVLPDRPRITHVRSTETFTMVGAMVSARFMQSALSKGSYKTRGVVLIAQHPVLALTPQEQQCLLHGIRRMKEEHTRIGHLFYYEILKCAYEKMVLDINDIYLRRHADSLKCVDQNAWIVQRFIDLLQQGLAREHRTVEYYASRLNLSAQYLSKTCVKFSGHNASFFIDHFATEEIARLLKDGGLSIADVACRMNFSSTNYFTRYVKRVLGMLPKDYRARFNAGL